MSTLSRVREMSLVSWMPSALICMYSIGKLFDSAWYRGHFYAKMLMQGEI